MNRLRQLLEVAVDLERTGRSYNLFDLAVTAWLRKPTLFGLDGYETVFPDLAKTKAVLYGGNGAFRAGLFDRTGGNPHDPIALTSAGRARAGVRRRGPRRDRLLATPAQQELLTRLTDTTAHRKVLSGLRGDVTFAEACAFWGLDDGNRDPEPTRLKLRALCGALDDTTDLILDDGRVVEWREAAALSLTDLVLADRFARHLRLLRTKKEHAVKTVPTGGV